MVKDFSLSSTTKLNQLLAGRTPEVQAAVRRLVLERGWDVDDPMVEFFIALGMTETILLQHPEKVEVLCEGFIQALNQWQQQNYALCQQMLAANQETAERLKTFTELAETHQQLMETAKMTEAQLQQAQRVVDAHLAELQPLKAAIAQLARRSNVRVSGFLAPFPVWKRVVWWVVVVYCLVVAGGNLVVLRWGCFEREIQSHYTSC